MDQAPRELSVQQLQLLPHFAEMVVRHMEKDRKALLQQAAAGRLLTRSIECVSEVQPGRLPQLAGRWVPVGATGAVHCLCSVWLSGMAFVCIARGGPMTSAHLFGLESKLQAFSHYKTVCPAC